MLPREIFAVKLGGIVGLSGRASDSGLRFLQAKKTPHEAGFFRLERSTESGSLAATQATASQRGYTGAKQPYRCRRGYRSGLNGERQVVGTRKRDINAI